MKIRKKKIIGIFSAITFVLALLVNISLSLDNPLMIVNKAALAQSSSSSNDSSNGGSMSNCTSDWDCTDYLARNVAEAVYSTSMDAQVSVSIEGIPVQINLASSQLNTGFIGMYAQCRFSWTSSCDKRDQGWQ